MKTRDKKELIMMVIGLMLYLVLAYWIFYVRVAPAPPDHVVWEKIKKAMRHHGIHAAECVGDRCWFYRDGQRISL